MNAIFHGFIIRNLRSIYINISRPILLPFLLVGMGNEANAQFDYITGQWYVLLPKTSLTEIVLEIPTVPV